MLYNDIVEIYSVRDKNQAVCGFFYRRAHSGSENPAIYGSGIPPIVHGLGTDSGLSVIVIVVLADHILLESHIFLQAAKRRFRTAETGRHLRCL